MLERSRIISLMASIALAVAASLPQVWAGGNKIIKRDPNPPFVVPDVCALGGTSVVQHNGLLLTSNPGNAGFDVFPSNPGGPATSIFSNTIPFPEGTFSFTQTILQNTSGGPIVPSLVLGIYSSAPGVPVDLSAATTTDASNTHIFITTSPPTGSSGQLLGLLVFYHDSTLDPLVISATGFHNSFTIQGGFPHVLVPVGIDATHNLTCGSP